MNWVAGTVPAYMDRWGIQQNGETLTTPSSWLVPGRWHDRNVMLKVARIAEEARGARLLARWAGSAAAEVYEVDDQAVLMDRASGQRDLTAMCQAGRDDEATHILCETIASLHTENSPAPADVVPLQLWFQDLIGPGSVRPQTGNIGRAAAMARTLLQASAVSECVVLHGDVHHRLAIVSEHSGLDVDEVRSWVIAWCALSVTWTDNSGGQPWTAHAILDAFA